jgi:hypothetical protein
VRLLTIGRLLGLLGLALELSLERLGSIGSLGC